MEYGSNDKGEAYFHLTPQEHERFKKGKPIVKYTGCAKGEFKIILQMQKTGKADTRFVTQTLNEIYSDPKNQPSPKYMAALKRQQARAVSLEERNSKCRQT
jgi:hypothetical protein